MAFAYGTSFGERVFLSPEFHYIGPDFWVAAMRLAVGSEFRMSSRAPPSGGFRNASRASAAISSGSRVGLTEAFGALAIADVVIAGRGPRAASVVGFGVGADFGAAVGFGLGFATAP